MKKPVKSNSETCQEIEEVNERTLMMRRMLECIDKGTEDEINETYRYAPYDEVPEFVTLWPIEETHGMLNDVAIIIVSIKE
ncbi:hypothetical protein CWI41_011770 [Ordospora colligata]|nr:hypothetical protein CWI41_011770 [Ordospora colligata]TBU17522.1 hypothetical protein CWI40_011770 [Ordospora colligata]